ncbi:uncharacterized protein [Periplaneta americana]|uniref:uncharacterized protein isoform X2 n=1 Tax=Periplaneta americana TaxID=6978 RepID=UPI0037E8EA30
MWDPGSDPGTETPPQNVEKEDLEDQFQQQQEKIAQLKELLKQNEQKLVDKEKEVEQYATKLSDIRSRSRLSKHKSAGVKQDSNQLPVKDAGSVKEESVKDETPTPGKSTDKIRQGNLVLLRKKLEENRLKFEQRGKELNENKKGIEEMVQHLKTQLDERDVTIQELQKGLEAMHSPRPTGLQEARENILTVPESSELSNEEKDRKIIELNNKVVELEATILDLQENFREKDSVIDARTKAITLMSEDFSRRNKTILDNLEETRDEMRKMQNNFVIQETKMRDEIEQLKKELVTKNNKLHHLEESNKSLESVRFELSTRNAELQEKVVRIQERVAEVQEKPSCEDAEHQDIVLQLDEANKQNKKMRGRIKSLTKQLDGLRKVSDANEEILKLQNRIAELEEDKVSESHWQTRVSELEERVTQQSSDLDSHVHMITLLEAEKVDHLQGIQTQKEKVSQLEAELQEMKTSFSELENQKVSLEMRTVDLEEQIDILNKENLRLQEEMDVISRLNQSVEGREIEMTANPVPDSEATNVFQSLEVVERHKQDDDVVSSENKETEKSESQDLNITYEQLEAKLLYSNQIIEEQREIITDLKSKTFDHEEELELQREMISKLEQMSGDDNDKDARISEIVKELSEVASDLEEWKIRCIDVEKKLQNLGIEKSDLENHFKEVKNENSMLHQQLVEHKEIAAELSAKLKEQSIAIASRDERISSLQSLIEINGQTLEAREMTLKDVHEKLNSVEKQFESKHSQLKVSLANKEKELTNMTETLTKQDEILKDKEVEIMRLHETLNKQSHELSFLQQQLTRVEENISHHLHAQLDDMSRNLAEKTELNCQLTEECLSHKQKIEGYALELSDKIEYIRKLERENEKFRELETQLEMAASKLASREEELDTLKQELACKHTEVEEKLSKLKECEGKITELTEKNKKFIANLKAKAVSIKGYEQKVEQYEAVIKAKEDLILELTSQNEKLLEYQSDKTLSNTLEENLQKIDLLMKELNEERLQTELIGEELSKATEKIVSLENELKLSEMKLSEMSFIEEARATLLSKVAELEREISLIQMELRNKGDQITLIEDEKVRITEEFKVKENEWANQMSDMKCLFENKIKELQSELEQQKSEGNNAVEKLIAEKNVILEQTANDSNSSEKVNELQSELISRHQRISELEELLMSTSEKNEQSLAASNAKLQERDAVIESLEQELCKSQERVQHLEQGLATVEERRQSLENKAEVLNMRLQESDRMKEEVVENEEMLEQRLTSLITSEENLKKRLEIMSRENEESLQKLAELTKENSEFKKELINSDTCVKCLQKELERLSPFEYSFSAASERTEALEAELKRVGLEFEHRMKEKVQNMQQQAENLESDLRNVNIQLEQVELERKTLMEQYEKLNDEKINLEDEIEGLNNTVEIYKTNNSELKKELEKNSSAFENSLSLKEASLKELEEKVHVLESELQEKVSECREREVTNTDLSSKVELLEKELITSSAAVESQASEKERVKSELRDKINLLEKELEEKVSSLKIISTEKDGVERELQAKIELQETELKKYQEMVESKMTETQSDPEILAGIVDPEQITKLHDELNHLKSVIEQKDGEIRTYQTRLLQLQFGNVPNTGHTSEHDSNASLLGKVSQLENLNSKLQETLQSKETQISNLSAAMAASDTELQHHKSELIIYENKIEELKIEISSLQEEVMNKNNHIQQLQINLAENSLSVSSQTCMHESQLSSLEQQKLELYNELLKSKAQQEVSQIVKVAEERVQEMQSLANDDDVDDSVRKPKFVTFHEPVSEWMPLQDTTDRIRTLEEELHLTKMERDEALLRIQELVQVRSTSVSLEEGGAEMSRVQMEKQWQQVENLKKEVVVESDEPLSLENNSMGEATAEQSEQSLPLPETVLNFESSSWDVGDGGEEEGWGWGSDEARLEEEHIQKQQQTLLSLEPANALSDQLVALENHIKVLEMEKEKLSEELRASQVRSGKMLKKLKDLKLRNECLMKENMELTKSNSDKTFGDLDQAIEEELKIRIDSLEKELKEIKNERNSAQAEKEGLLNRIDMLTSANERYMEVKERQDMDVEAWKQKNKDLSNQIQSLEWKIEELMEEKKQAMGQGVTDQGEKDPFFSWDKHGFASDSGSFIAVESNNKELHEQVAALSADNENLQVLLEQQRNLRLAAEDQLRQLEQQLIQAQSEVASLTEEQSKLKQEVEMLSLAREHMETVEDVQELKQEYNRLLEERNTFQSSYQALKSEYDRVCKESETYVTATEEKYEKVQLDYGKKIEDIYNEKIKIEDLYKNLLKNHDHLTEEVQMLTTSLADLNQQYDILKLECNGLREHLSIQQSSQFADEQNLNRDDIAQLKLQLEMRIVDVERKLQEKIAETEMLHQMIESQKLEQVKVEQEWNNRVEHLRKELEFNSENLLRQQDLYSLLSKEYQDLKDQKDEIIKSCVEETLNSKEQQIAALRNHFSENEAKLNLQNELLQIKEGEIQNLNQRVVESTNLLIMRDSDIEQLKNRLFENESRVGNLLMHKDQEINSLQAQLSEKESRIKELQHALEQETKRLADLQEHFKDQEFQLTQLRDKLGVEKLQSEKHSRGLQPFPGSQTSQQHPVSSYEAEESASSEESLGRRRKKESESTDSQQEELDLALYMLHQRDVRCDELTLELMQLLEERDSLQLRLSNALRLNEELKAKSTNLVAVDHSFRREEAPQHVVATVSTQNAAVEEPQEDLQSLASKLSQLRSVGYHRDVTLQDEREQRHNEQVRLLHQRGSGIVVDANYTLSRDVQSPSTVLLNWIWGRSTPKVVHI